MQLAQEPVLSRFMIQIMMYGDHMMLVQALTALTLKQTGTLNTHGQQFQLMEIAQSLSTRSISVMTVMEAIIMLTEMIVHGIMTLICVELEIMADFLLVIHIVALAVEELQQQMITGIQLMVSGMMQWETKDSITQSE